LVSNGISNRAGRVNRRRVGVLAGGLSAGTPDNALMDEAPPFCARAGKAEE
jgi:hypothetical protein